MNKMMKGPGGQPMMPPGMRPGGPLPGGPVSLGGRIGPGMGHPGGPPGLGLAHHALAHLARVQAVVKTQAPDVTVGPDPLDPRDLPDLGHLGRRCSCHRGLASKRDLDDGLASSVRFHNRRRPRIREQGHFISLFKQDYIHICTR